MIIGFCGEPSSPIVEAYGIPISMWVAWFSPRVSRSRITAQEASFEIVDSMPYFLNSPSSWAITIDEQSVRAMMPNANVWEFQARPPRRRRRPNPPGIPANSKPSELIPESFRKLRRVNVFCCCLFCSFAMMLSLQSKLISLADELKNFDL